MISSALPGRFFYFGAFLALSLVLVPLATPSLAQDSAAVGATSTVDAPLRIAIFDLTKISDAVIQHMPTYRQISQEVEAKRTNLKGKEDEIKNLQHELETMGSVLSDEQIAARQGEIRSKLDSYQAEVKATEKTYDRKYDELIKPLNDKIEDEILKWFEAQNYDLILEADIVRFNSDRVEDLTDSVIEYLKSKQNELDPGPVTEGVAPATDTETSTGNTE